MSGETPSTSYFAALGSWRHLSSDDVRRKERAAGGARGIFFHSLIVSLSLYSYRRLAPHSRDDNDGSYPSLPHTFGEKQKKNQSFQVRGFALTFFRGVCVCVKELSLSETLCARWLEEAVSGHDVLR